MSCWTRTARSAVSRHCRRRWIPGGVNTTGPAASVPGHGLPRLPVQPG
jgi:hypothetical protein